MAWRWRFRYLKPLFRGGPNLFKHGASVTFGGHSPVHYTTRSAGSTVSLRMAPGLWVYNRRPRTGAGASLSAVLLVLVAIGVLATLLR